MAKREIQGWLYIDLRDDKLRILKNEKYPEANEVHALLTVVIDVPDALQPKLELIINMPKATIEKLSAIQSPPPIDFSTHAKEPESIKDAVWQALYNANANGYGEDWGAGSSYEISKDLVKYSAELDHLEPADVEDHVIEWLTAKGVL